MTELNQPCSAALIMQLGASLNRLTRSRFAGSLRSARAFLLEIRRITPDRNICRSSSRRTESAEIGLSGSRAYI